MNFVKSGVLGSNCSELAINISGSKRDSEQSEENCMAEGDGQNGNRRGALIALSVVVFLFAIGWLLARELYTAGRSEDCLLSGRTNCAPIAVPAR